MARKQAATKRTDSAPRRGKTYDMYVVSESTGSLARQMMSVILSQFPRLRCEVHHCPFCTSTAKLMEIRQAIAESSNTLVFSALTKPVLKRSLLEWCEQHSVGHVDLVGDVVQFVATHCNQGPLHDATRAHRVDAKYLDRIEAWEFTLQHDDGRRIETIPQADIVLLGVSRVGKTPLAAYLGSLGYRVANVALAPGCAIPAQVKAVRDRAIGLTVDPDRLSEIRERRFDLNRFKSALATRNLNPEAYFGAQAVRRELAYAAAEFRRLKVPVLDVTDMTVEESAARILLIINA